MSRIENVSKDELDARQQKLYDEIMRDRPRPQLSGPFSIWINTPGIAEPSNALANFFRHQCKLDQRLVELIILTVCRDANAKYAWSAHEPLARKAGLTPETIGAIRNRKQPDFKQDDEKLIYDLVRELLTTKSLSAASFDRAIAMLGRDRLIEAVSCAGMYCQVGFVVNAFDIPTNPGGDVLPD
ncbi:MAG TPA: carboxymuconolactone decarboxylase family protein [Xanthobacteraceae bacterium]|jgi:4-carboxymuconolactone decarboxylase|nr:carboxymuconolactone decarboxylase family protein [Xanthobacteraceae bacterium]